MASGEPPEQSSRRPRGGLLGQSLGHNSWMLFPAVTTPGPVVLPSRLTHPRTDTWPKPKPPWSLLAYFLRAFVITDLSRVMPHVGVSLLVATPHKTRLHDLALARIDDAELQHLLL